MIGVDRATLRQLAEPLPPSDIEWRLQQSGEKNGKIWGKVLAYVTNRAIMARLDDVVGPENWKNEFRASVGAKDGGVMCGLSIRVAVDGGAEWITKWDGADETDIESTKGGISNAMKRAAVQWGLGRYLYDLEEGWAVVSETGKHAGKTREGKWFKWDPPVLPTWAQPKPASNTGAAPSAPARMTAGQHSQIESLLASVTDEAILTKVRNRVASGLTREAADEAIRYLKSIGATPSIGGPVPAPGRKADALALTSEA